ncbi:IMPACT family member in pol 5'region [Deinococcus aerius]|uniref:IMPACT family member in pol 5'region n=1 Tax=Deinococcus aerius TaxID=200253 RepID=A0A2I9D8N6_9DEIO|nr:YigZ family protein [Deinococcus aerius]GBF07196.1 IMPACT family member in pol 5'region [Deinococcus aerius]
MTGSDLPAPFTTLASPHRLNAVIENSEFLAFAQRADTPEEALSQLAALRERYPDATHHCWAYHIGPLYRFHDDGEPGGTAGAPILRAIEGQGVDHVMVVVVRSYGGVKLGTGGLVRAYGGTAAECLRTAPRETVRPRRTLTVQVPFEHLSALYHLLGTFDTVRGEEGYTASGVTLDVGVHPEDAGAFAAALRDATRGAAGVEGPDA